MIELIVLGTIYAAMGLVALTGLVGLGYLWGAGVPALKRAWIQGAYQGTVPPGVEEKPTPILDLVLFTALLLFIGIGVGGIGALTWIFGAL